MSKRPKSAEELMRISTCGEMVRELSKEPGLVRVEEGAGSCIKFYGKNGMVPVHNHPSKQLAYGTKRSIVRMAVLAGIVRLIVVLVIILGLLCLFAL